MTVKFESNLPTHVTWIKNNAKLKNSLRHKIQTRDNVSTLWINNILEKDEGEYLVKIENNKGQEISKAQLNLCEKTETCESKEKKQASLHIQKVLKPLLNSLTKIKISEEDEDIKNGKVIFYFFFKSY